MEKKKVMILTQSLSGGGAEKIAANLSIGLNESMDVYVVTYWETQKEYTYAGERINLNLLGKSLLGKIVCAIKRILIIKRIKKKLNINYTISVVPPCDYVNIFSHTKNEKTVIDVVSNMNVAFPKGISRLFRKFVMRKADYVVTVSEGVRQDLIENFGIKEQKSKTVYNAVDIDAIEAAATQKTNTIEGKYICSMGSFRYPKGHWHLIKAFYTIMNDFPDRKLVILGDGLYREKYQKLIDKLGMRNRVIMPGFLNPPHGVIAGSELFVFSSVFEGFGNAVIEAMACGVPVVRTDCKYGPREILAPDTKLTSICQDIEESKYGILVPPFNMDDIDITETIIPEEYCLGRAIRMVLTDAGLAKKYATSGREYCRKFDNSSITDDWRSILCEL